MTARQSEDYKFPWWYALYRQELAVERTKRGMLDKLLLWQIRSTFPKVIDTQDLNMVLQIQYFRSSKSR